VFPRSQGALSCVSCFSFLSSWSCLFLVTFVHFWRLLVRFLQQNGGDF
jgi:hypothetical protein